MSNELESREALLRFRERIRESRRQNALGANGNPTAAEAREALQRREQGAQPLTVAELENRMQRDPSDRGTPVAAERIRGDVFSPSQLRKRARQRAHHGG